MRIRIGDLTAQRFGRLLVLGETTRHDNRTTYVCRCDCGRLTTVLGKYLYHGLTKSCGCLKKDLARSRALRHGLATRREYRIWGAAKTRCYNPRVVSYPNYGGRGIAMAAEWREDFGRFYANMGPCPPGYTLDRIDTNGPYSPSNCRWADRMQQANNARSNRRVMWHGATHTISEWERLYVFKPGTLKGRLLRGWSIERAFTEPLRVWPSVHETAQSLCCASVGLSSHRHGFY